VKSLVLLAAAAAAVALAAPASAVRRAPTLRLVHGQPLVLAGAHFAGRERVAVIVHVRQPYLRKALTRADGSFTVSFGVVPAAHCSGLVAEAVGASGDRATLRLPHPACASQPGTS